MTGKQFKLARKTLNLSQTAMGEMLGMSRSSVWRYETGLQPVPKSADVTVTLLINTIDREKRRRLREQQEPSRRAG